MEKTKGESSTILRKMHRHISTKEMSTKRGGEPMTKVRVYHTIIAWEDVEMNDTKDRASAIQSLLKNYGVMKYDQSITQVPDVIVPSKLEEVKNN